MRIRILASFFIALTVMCGASAQSGGAASAQAFPTRPIRLVVNTSAGSSPDLIARAVARQAENFLGQNLIIDNRTGANGIIGAVIVAHAAPDGYTVLHTSPGVILNAVVHKKLQYDIHKDFIPVTQVAA